MNQFIFKNKTNLHFNFIKKICGPLRSKKTAIHTLKTSSSAMGDDTEMRFNYNRNALGDLGLGWALQLKRCRRI